MMCEMFEIIQLYMLMLEYEVINKSFYIISQVGFINIYDIRGGFYQYLNTFFTESYFDILEAQEEIFYNITSFIMQTFLS